MDSFRLNSIFWFSLCVFLLRDMAVLIDTCLFETSCFLSDLVHTRERKKYEFIACLDRNTIKKGFGLCGRIKKKKEIKQTKSFYFSFIARPFLSSVWAAMVTCNFDCHFMATSKNWKVKEKKHIINVTQNWNPTNYFVFVFANAEMETN